MATTNYSGYSGGNYEASRRGVESKYTTDSATNAYGRFLSQQRGSRDLSDQTRDFKQSYPGYGAQFGQRGLSGSGVRSGVQQQSMANYVGDYNRNYGRTQQDITQGLQQYDLSQSQLDTWRQDELMNIEMQRSQEIASTAATLAALQQYLGGL